ncbi:MAG: hypothetical protein PHV34_21040 [Verrucomicrobiae bacterium]|nr:hypothetical protein [Verrucomicrobiae bacterium]
MKSAFLFLQTLLNLKNQLLPPCLQRLCCALMILVFVLTAGQAASFSSDNERQTAKELIGQLSEEIVVFQLVAKLQLSRDQAQKLLPLVAQARSLGEKYHREQQPLLGAQLNVFGAFLAEDMRDAGFSPGMEKKVWELERRGLEDGKRFAELLNILELKTSEVLKGQQEQWLEAARQPADLRLFFATGHAVGEPGGAGRPSRDQAEQVRAELAEIYREKYGSIGTTGHFLLAPGLTACLERQVGMKRDGVVFLEQKNLWHANAGILKKVRDLRSDINLVNLINGLHLTREQMKTIAVAARSYGRLCGDDPAAVDPAKAEEYVALLKKVWELVFERRPVPPSVLRQGGRLEQECGGRRRCPGPAAEEAGRSLIARVEGILSDAQKKVMEDYKTCLIPPRDLRDPVRTGQVDDASGEEAWLDEAKRIPENQSQNAVEAFAEKILSRVERHYGRFDGVEREARKKWLVDFLGQVRRMSEVDFQLNKAEWAAKLKTLRKNESLRERLVTLTGGRENELRKKIKRHLLNPRLAPLIETRLKGGKGKTAP